MHIEWIGDCPSCVPVLAHWHVAAFADVLATWTIDEAAFELRGHVARLAVPTTWVAFEDDRLVGSVSLLNSDLPAPDRYAPWLASLFVDPAARGRGIGASLVRRAVAEAHQLGLPTLHLWTPKHADFYRRLSWQSLGTECFGGIAVTLMRIDCAETQ